MRTVQNLDSPLGVKNFKVLRRMGSFIFEFNGMWRLKFEFCLKKILRQILRRFNLKQLNWLCAVGLKS